MAFRPLSRRTAAVCAGTGILTLAVLITGCTDDASVSSSPPPASASPTAIAPTSPSPSATEEAGDALKPDGTAEQNLPFFRDVVRKVWAGDDREHGRAYIDALTDAGFDKEDMQVTEDRSTVDHPAESLQFSVRWHDGHCLVGQVGPATGHPVTAVMPALQNGLCLLGRTRAIDW